MQANDISWVSYLTAIGTTATPILALIITAIGWKIRNQLESTRELKAKLREERIDIYNSILEPFIIMFSPDEGVKNQQRGKKKGKFELATEKLISVDYRKVGFQLALTGSDEVVVAYNNMLQYFFSRNLESPAETSEQDIIMMLQLMGKFLLEIRKSLGNDTSQLSEWDMLEWFITDARKYKSKRSASKQVQQN